MCPQVIILPAELSAAAVLINYWNHDINNAVWITICMVVVVAINLLGASAPFFFFSLSLSLIPVLQRHMGPLDTLGTTLTIADEFLSRETEFWFCSIKVLTITGLIILGIVLDLGGGPNHDRIGFRYWKDPGPFVQFDGIAGAKGRFLGWWAVMTQAAFSFIGTEIVAIAAGEAKNPRRNIVSKRLILKLVDGTKDSDVPASGYSPRVYPYPHLLHLVWCLFTFLLNNFTNSRL
jgi:yeast amino acid transporter